MYKSKLSKKYKLTPEQEAEPREAFRNCLRLEKKKTENDAHVIIRRFECRPYDGDSKCYTNEPIWHLALICHKNTRYGDAVVRLGKHESDDSHLLARIAHDNYAESEVGWFVGQAKETGCWIDGHEVSAKFVRHACKLVELDDGSWEIDE